MEPLRMVNVKQCSLCPGNTEYFCHTCELDFCYYCKERHVIDLDTKHHNITIFRRKYNYILKHETCANHPDQISEKFCKTCDIPICFLCKKHKKHTIMNIRSAYNRTLRQCKNLINDIRCHSLYNGHILLTELISDVKAHLKAYKEGTPNIPSDVIAKYKRLNYLMDSAPRYISYSHRCSLQKKKITQHIARIETFEHEYEQTANKPVRLFQLIKKTRLTHIQDTPHLTQHCLLSLDDPEIKMWHLIKLLMECKITMKRKRNASNKSLLKMMINPVLQKYLTVTCVDNWQHISHAKPDQFWVSDMNNGYLVLTDTATGHPLHNIDDVLPGYRSAVHTVNNKFELIYIKKDYHIDKLSNDRRTRSTIIKRIDSTWEPLCVHCSKSTGDILVGMYCPDTDKGKVARYNDSGELTQTIQYDTPGNALFTKLHHITENNNGDVVVADVNAVVVTERGGRHRFSYTGSPEALDQGSYLRPIGICTDPLSHILVLDSTTNSIHMIDENGIFLTFLLRNQHLTHSLSYDDNTHTLWVGFMQRLISVYRYLNRYLPLTGKSYFD